MVRASPLRLAVHDLKRRRGSVAEVATMRFPRELK